MAQRRTRTWQWEFEQWLKPFLKVLGHKARRPWAPIYLRGLLAPGERKSIQPLAARVAPGAQEQVHHFVAASAWPTAPLERVLAEQAQRLVGGLGAALIVDDTALPKQGHCSVGVAHQYAGVLGKQANCQCLVSLTLAHGDVPVAITLRLVLPKEWTDDPARCQKVGVPDEHQRARAKGTIALEEIDRVRAAGVTFDVVLADAGYGTSARFRHALSARGLNWAVGILRIQTVYQAEVRILPRPRAPLGRPPKYPHTSDERLSAEKALAVLPADAWQPVTWRRGTKGPLAAHFAARRVRVADGGRMPGASTCRATRSGWWANAARRASTRTTSAISRRTHPSSSSRPRSRRGGSVRRRTSSSRENWASTTLRGARGAGCITTHC